MFVIPAILLFLLAIYVRPHELFSALEGVPLLYVGLGMAVVGLAIDLRVRAAKPIIPPPIGQAIWFLGWLLFATSLVNRAHLAERLLPLLLLFLLLVTIAMGVQTFRMLHVVTVALVLFGTFIGLLLVAQRFSPTGCIEPADTVFGYEISGIECSVLGDGDECEAGGDPTKEYRCVNIGPLGITSIDGRVRYIGVLQDPNEVSMVLACFLPFLIALYEFKKSIGRAVALAGTFVLFGAVTIFSQSRGGQLVLICVLGTYFVMRYGVKGALVGMVGALGVLTLKGSRSAEEADASRQERLELMYNGMTMAKENIALGVGYMHFEDFSHLTAHNTWILTAAELGLVGLFFFNLLLYTCFQIAWTGLKRYRDRPEARIAFVWCRAITASIIGTAVGITFLSFTYKSVLWIQLGLYGAVYTCIRNHDPDFEVRLKLKDLVYVAGGTLFLWIANFMMTRLNPPT